MIAADIHRLWAMRPEVLAERFRGAGPHAAHGPVPLLTAQMHAGQMMSTPALYQVSADGEAVIPIRGVMRKSACPVCVALHEETESGKVQAAVNAAAADPLVKTIALDIDSPGGEVAGVPDLAEAVWAAAHVKPVVARVSDLCASAAYWVACQAGRVTVNNSTAQVGSIGIYGVMLDMSEAAAEAGIKVHVIRAGKFKGIGIPGTPLDEEQLSEIQRVIDETNGSFLSAVARGRGLAGKRLDAAADGRIFLGASAVDAGLIDGYSVADMKTSTHVRSAAGGYATKAEAAPMPDEPKKEEKERDLYADGAPVKNKATGRYGRVSASAVGTGYAVAYAGDDAPYKWNMADDLEPAKETDMPAEKKEEPRDETPKEKPAAQGDRFARAQVLMLAHVGHEGRIMAGVNAGHTDADIKLAIVTAERDEGRKALAASEARVSAAGRTPGTAPVAASAPAAKAKPGEPVSEAEFNADQDLKAEFARYGVYAAYMRGVANKSIKLFG